MAQRPGYRGTVTGSAPGGTDATVTLPSTTVAGDWLVLFGSVDYGSVTNLQDAPSNVTDYVIRWTGFNSATNGLHTVIATARASQSGASVLTFTNPSTSQSDMTWAVAVVNASTVDTTTPFTIPTGTEYATAVSSLTAPAATPAADQSMILWGFSLRSGPTTTYPAPIFTTTTSKIVEVSSRQYVTTGLYGVYLSTAATRAAFAIAVRSGRAAVATAGTVVVNGAPDAPTAPTAPKLNTFTDRLTALVASLWPTLTNSGGPSPTHDAKRKALSVPVTIAPGGGPNYAAGRTAEAYSFAGPSFLSFRCVRAPDGGTANAQAWVKQPDAQGVGRLGWEWRVTDLGVIALDCIGQGAGYAPVGTTTTLTYDQHVHRWLKLATETGGDLVWSTSVDCVTWTERRRLPAAEVPAWLVTRNDLAASFEGFRTAGNSSGFVYELIVDDINLAPEAPPTFPEPLSSGGVTTFAPDWSQPDNVAAGFTNNPSQRQSRTSGMGDTTVPYPIPILPAPFGRSGRALQFRIPDDYRRLEATPPTQYADGEQWLVGFSFLVEGDMDRVAQRGGYYQIVWQLHHAADVGSPPVGIEVRDNRLILAGGSNRPDPVTGSTATGNAWRYEKYIGTAAEHTILAGRWYDVVLAMGMWSAVTKGATTAENAGSGRLDLWLDGARLLTNYVPKCGSNIPGDGDLAYPKTGIYHDGTNRGCTVWIADYREGTSYAAVAPPAGKVSAFEVDPVDP